MRLSQARLIQLLRARGGVGVLVRTKVGGNMFLAQGESAPFQPRTITALLKDGYAIREGNRVRLLALQ